MSTRQRGLLVLIGIIVVAVVFCAYIPFVVMPSNGTGVALPIITVPGEILVEDGLLGADLTNTMVGTFLADIMLLIFALLAWRASRGWTKEVPNRFQALAETVVEVLYNFSKGIGGDRLRTAPFLWPLVATIFFFLLSANLLKLFPGVETVGKFHCSHIGYIGYPAVQGWTDSQYRLWVDTPFDAGVSTTEEMEHVCEAWAHGDFTPYASDVSAEDIEVDVADSEALLRQAEESYNTAAAVPEADRTEEQMVEYEALSEELHAQELLVELQHDRMESFEAIEGIETQIEALEIERETLAGAEEEDDHGEEEDVHAAGDEPEEHAEEVVGEIDITPEERIAEIDEEIAALEDEAQLYRTRLVYPGATFPLSEEEIEMGVIPYNFHITPFVRGAATDLSLAFALAIMSIFAVQAYGVWALGPAYFEKFINISALGNLGKKPLGAIDFVVGLIEIISEIGKIVSLAFRLFGNLFAGGVALIALTFLVAMGVPMIMYGLEIIIGVVQALVFAVLTLVFSVQAMEAHHGDDHEHEHGH